MKTKKLFTSLSFLTLAVGTFSFAFNFKSNGIEMSAGSIDINDYSACETAHKAKNATNLLSALRTITSLGHSGSYDGLYETYKAAYLKPNGKIFDYYSSITDYDPDKDRAGSYSKEGDCFNREHSIPQSWWGGGTGNQGSDPFIVVPTDGYVNNIRSSNPFGMVGSAKKTFSNSKSGTPDSSWGYSGSDVFEPDDSVKGDFARIYFYAIAKYSAASGWSGNYARTCFSGSDTTNCGLTPYAVKLFSYWSNLDPVSEWELNANNAIAPIQGNRNPFIDHPEYANTLWGNVTGYTEYTHGTPSLDGVTISKTSEFLISGHTTTISAASSNSSSITWTTSNSSIVSLSSSSSSSGASITLTAGNAGTATITATATIDGEHYSKTCEVEVSATKKVTSIEVQNPKVKYTVDEAFVKPTVIATYNDGSSENVTNSASYSGYDLSTTGVQTVTVTYSLGGATKTATYQITVKSSGGTGEVVTAVIDFTDKKSSDEDDNGYTWSAHGEFTVGSSYLRLTSSDTYISNDPAISMDTTEDISITATLRTYGGVSGQSFVLGAYDTNGTLISNTLTLSPTNSDLHEYSGTLSFTTSQDTDVVIKGYSGNNSSLGISGMSVQYKESSSGAKTLESIGISTAPTKIYYEVGETFNPSGLIISRYYSDGTDDTYSYSGHTSEFTFIPSTSTPLNVDDDSIEIIYSGQSCFQEIEVTVPVELVSIEISGYTTSFVEGDTFAYGGTVIAHYADSSSVNVTSSASFAGYNMTIVGNQTVTVSFGNKSQTYSITVSVGTLSSIAVSEMTTTFVKNGAFSFDGTCTATFENGYQKIVTPTSVSAPDMSTTGTKTVTVSYIYNGNTRTANYQITVNSYRHVYEETESLIGTIEYTSDEEIISDPTLSTSSSGGYSKIDTQYHAWRLGASGKTGTLTVKSTSTNIYKIVVNAKYYSSDSGTRFTIGGTSYNLTSSFTDYTKAFDSAVNQVAISSVANGKRVLIASIVVYTKTEEDIGQTEDCLGLETYINNYMHMDYTENLGYCNDSEHHYYATAKAAFNDLNDHQRALFTGNSAYLAEWTRLSTWASKNGDALNTNNSLVAFDISDSIDSYNAYTSLIIIIVVCSLSTCLLLGLLIFKKRRLHE